MSDHLAEARESLTYAHGDDPTANIDCSTNAIAHAVIAIAEQLAMANQLTFELAVVDVDTEERSKFAAEIGFKDRSRA